MIIKVCGMKHQAQVNALDPLVNFIGFIFYEKSPRFVEQTPSLRHAQKVGVFVNESLETVKKHIAMHSLDFVQLHGNESPEYCRSIGDYAKVIKAFGVNSSQDFDQLTLYDNVANYFLFDTKTPKHGGSGRQFDWNILSKYTGKTPFILGGGINPDSIQQLKEINHSKFIGIDLNSGFEHVPSDKNIDQLITFINEITSTKIHSA